MNEMNEMNNIERIVGRYFIRVMKNHNKYDLFKKGFKTVANTSKGDSNPFGRCKDYSDMLVKLGKFTEKDYEAHKREGTRYEFVTMMINHLLHFFCEKGCQMHPEHLGKYGQEIFDLSCYAAFGQEFLEDMEVMKQQMGGVMPHSEEEARMMHEYMVARKNGLNISLEEFMRRFREGDDEEVVPEPPYQGGDDFWEDDEEWVEEEDDEYDY